MFVMDPFVFSIHSAVLGFGAVDGEPQSRVSVPWSGSLPSTTPCLGLGGINRHVRAGEGWLTWKKEVLLPQDPCLLVLPLLFSQPSSTSCLASTHPGGPAPIHGEHGSNKKRMSSGFSYQTRPWPAHALCSLFLFFSPLCGDPSCPLLLL